MYINTLILPLDGTSSRNQVATTISFNTSRCAGSVKRWSSGRRAAKIVMPARKIDARAMASSVLCQRLGVYAGGPI
jgi:hypothetical protein